MPSDVPSGENTYPDTQVLAISADFPFLDDDIGTLSGDTAGFMKRHSKLWHFLIPLDILCSIVLAWFWFTSGSTYSPQYGNYYSTSTPADNLWKGLLVSIMLPLLVIFLPFLVVAFKTALREFMQHFAAVAGYTFALSAPLSSVAGDLFEIGRDKSISNVASGTYKNKPLRLFNYQFTAGSGKTAMTYTHTIIEIQFEKPLIEMRLVASDEETFVRFPTSENKEKVVLEGNFNKYFDLHVPQGASSEIDVREIFTPDFMENLIKEYPKADFECRGKKLYVFRYGYVASKQDFIGLYSLMHFVIGKLNQVSSGA